MKGTEGYVGVIKRRISEFKIWWINSSFNITSLSGTMLRCCNELTEEQYKEITLEIWVQQRRRLCVSNLFWNGGFQVWSPPRNWLEMQLLEDIPQAYWLRYSEGETCNLFSQALHVALMQLVSDNHCPGVRASLLLHGSPTLWQNKFHRYVNGNVYRKWSSSDVTSSNSHEIMVTEASCMATQRKPMRARGSILNIQELLWHRPYAR